MAAGRSALLPPRLEAPVTLVADPPAVVAAQLPLSHPMSTLKSVGPALSVLERKTLKCGTPLTTSLQPPLATRSVAHGTLAPGLSLLIGRAVSAPLLSFALPDIPVRVVTHTELALRLGLPACEPTSCAFHLRVLLRRVVRCGHGSYRRKSFSIANPQTRTLLSPEASAK